MARYEPIPQWEDDYDIPDDDDDDDDNADQTGAFVPNGASTPAPEFQTEQKEKGGFSELPKVPEDFLTELPVFQQQLLLLRARLTKSFPMQTKTRSNSSWIEKEGQE